MKKPLVFSLCLLGAACLGGQAVSAPLRPGTTAPVFTGRDSNGKPVNLSSFKSKYIVLEWFNHHCPYVRKHYDTRKMQMLQEKYTRTGVIWLSINSTPPNKLGYTVADGANTLSREKGAAPSAIILDPDGAIGRLYGITVTPQVVVIDPNGKVIYQGAIDDAASVDPGDIEDAMNYVDLFLEAALAGEEVEDSEPSNASYGCPIQYPDVILKI